MTSRCFMFMYFLQPHCVPATWRSLAHGLQHPQTLVADDKLHAVQAASAKPYHSPCRKSGTFQNKKAATVSDSRRVG